MIKGGQEAGMFRKGQRNKTQSSFFYRLSFHNKLFIIFLPLVFLFIIITGSACLYISGNQLKVNTRMLMENSIHQTATLIDYKLHTMYIRSVSIVNSPAFTFFVFDHRKGDPIDRKYLQNRNKLYQQLTDIAVDNWDLIDSFVILEKSGNNMVYMGSPSSYVMKDTYDTILQQQSLYREGSGMFQYIWQNQHTDMILNTRIPRQVLTLYSITGNTDSTAGAVMALNIRSEFITDILKNIVSSEGSFAAVLSADSMCCYEESPGAWKLKETDIGRMLGSRDKGSYITEDGNGNQILLSFEKLKTNDWVVVNGVPVKSIMTGTEPMKKMILILVMVMLTIAGMPVLFISRWLSRDITGLAEQIEQYEIGKAAADFHTDDQKELSRVAGALNQMVRTIQGQIRERIEVEKRKRKAELFLLQSQINPHFLYNTLISVKTLIDLQRYQMASNMFQSLIDFYVIALNHGRERTSIRRELEIIRNYLSLLAVRYNHSFEWVINVEEDIMDCEILTLTLQPLVENSLQHGVKSKTGKGMIDISGCAFEGKVILTVWDNGLGIRPEQMNELRDILNKKEIPDNQEAGHFGLWNSNQRLRLYFGDEYGIRLDSEWGRYTSVTVTIPDRRHEGNG